MKVIHNAAKAEVTEVVVVAPAVPESFDLIGLDAPQMAAIAILLGNCAGSAKGIQSLYGAAYKALGVDNDDIPDISVGDVNSSLNLSSDTVERLLKTRK